MRPEEASHGSFPSQLWMIIYVYSERCSRNPRRWGLTRRRLVLNPRGHAGNPILQRGLCGRMDMIPDRSSMVIFLSAALVLLAIPGPAVIYVVGRSIGQGRGAGFVSALGIGVGTCIHVAAAAVGLSALLMSSAVAFGAVKYLGAAYLIYLGVQKLRREESLELNGSGARVKLSRVFGQGVIVNVLNPKTALFFFAFLPQFVDASRGPVARQILFLGLLFATMGVVSDSLWGLFAGTVAERLSGNARWARAQRYVSGGMLISLGLATAVSGHAPRK